MIVRDYEQSDYEACRALFEELVETHRALYPEAEARDGGAVRIFVRPTARNREAIMFFHSVGFECSATSSCRSTSSRA